jgi:hypothetical protein
VASPTPGAGIEAMVREWPAAKDRSEAQSEGRAAHDTRVPVVRAETGDADDRENHVDTLPGLPWVQEQYAVRRPSVRIAGNDNTYGTRPNRWSGPSA